MIAYEGQHTIHKMGGQLYWRNGEGTMEGINNGFALFSSENLEAENQETRFSVRFGINGVQRYKVNGELLKVTDDQFLVMNKGTLYDVKGEDRADTTMLAFCFNEQFVSDFVTSVSRTDEQLLDSFDLYRSDLKSLEFPLHTLLVDEKIKPMICDIVQAKLRLETDEVDDYSIFNRVLQMVVQNNKSSIDSFKGQDIVKNSTKVELYKRLSIARDYIQAHFSEDLNLSELSRVACLSPYHFHRAFKNTFKITPKKLVTHLRIERAKWLLENRSYSVQMICQEVGFRDVSSFTRLFASYTGVTPSVYRSMFSGSLRSIA
ncbi:MAG: helix-turn-helix transcriptional regulator [Roseivirga sp.]|nr:helix-turn-helix transcriptional regulator [Roseivirga sp.]